MVVMELATQQSIELGKLRLKLKPGLSFSQRLQGKAFWYVVSDSVNGKHFQVGETQYAFLSLLDGKRTVNQIASECSTILNSAELTEQDATSLCKWAIDSGLIESDEASILGHQIDSTQARSFSSLARRLNPLSVKLNLFCPDRLVSGLESVIRPLLNRASLIFWFLVLITGFLSLLFNLDPILFERIKTLGPNDAMLLGLTWIALKLLHESAHAIACKRLGGQVSSAGIVLLLLIPMPYVDVTSSWKFPRKSQRILTAAAGMMAELFVAAVACIAWHFVAPGSYRTVLENVIVMATIQTVLFNANPLMKFDGYYMLSDWMELPNLYSRGRASLKSGFRSLLFGRSTRPIAELGFRRQFIRLYGVLNVCWWVIVTTGLIVAAYNFYPGIGVILALVGAAFWIVVPAVMFARFLFSNQLRTRERLRFGGILFSFGLLLFAALNYAPAPAQIMAPAIVDFNPLKIICAKSPGFVSQIHVRSGQFVEQGDRLITLENPELKIQAELLSLKIEATQIRKDSFLGNGQVARYQVESENESALIEQLSELETLLESLEIRSPQQGVVMAEELNSILGTYIDPGSALLAVGDPDMLKVIALVPQDEIKWLSNEQLKPKFQLKNTFDQLNVELAQIQPRASTLVRHPALIAPNGGPLSVTIGSQETPSARERMNLIQPCFEVEYRLTKDSKGDVRPGQLGQIRIAARNESLGQYLKQHLSNFVRTNFSTDHGL